MHRMYIANVTRQNHQIHYRLDYNKDGELKDTNRQFQPANQQDIPAGRQIQVGGDFHMNQITEIVEQLSRYGMIGVVDVPRIDNREHKLVYNIDQPVPKRIMEQVQQHNSIMLFNDGKDRRTKAAVATNEMVQQAIENDLVLKGIDANNVPDSTEIGIEQLEQSEAGESRIEEGYRVSESAPPTPQPRAKARAPRQKRRAH